MVIEQCCYFLLCLFYKEHNYCRILALYCRIILSQIEYVCTYMYMYMYIVLYNLNTFNRLTYMYRVPTIYTTIFTYNCIQEYIIMIL